MDRRVIFEEAVGISKYKAHKKEAMRKLDRTEQNLLRLADIVGEVQKRLRSVKLQAGKARNYLQYSERLKELQVNYSLAEFHKLSVGTSEKKSALANVEEELAEVAKNDARMSNRGNEIIETETELNQTDNSLVSVRSKIEQQLQRIEFLRDRITELQQRKDDASRRSLQFQQQQNLFAEDLAKYQAEQANCEDMLEKKNQQTQEVQQSIQEINAQCSALEADLEDEKSGIIDIVRRTAQLHNELQSISIYRDNLSSQKERLSGRASIAQQELEKLLAQKAQNQVRCDDIEKVLSELQESLDSKRQLREEINDSLVDDNKRLAQNKETRSALSSELAILTDMETRREGLNNAVKSILKSRSSENDKFAYVEDVLADIVVADVEYAGTVEAALEGKTDAMVVNSTKALLENSDEIKDLDGRVSFLCLDQVQPFQDSVDLSKLANIRGRVVEFVKYKSKYAPLIWKLLGKTIIADSIGSAAELSGQLGSEYTFVTPKGEFLSSDGTIKLGPLGKTTGLISRKSRLRQIQDAISNVTNAIETIEEQIDKNNLQNEHLVKLCKDLRTAIYEANTEKMQVKSKLSVVEQNIARLSKEQPLIASEIDQLEEQIAQSVQKEYNSEQKLQELEAVNQERTKHIETLEQQCSEQRQVHQAYMDQLTDLKVELGQYTEQSKALKQTIFSLQNQIQQNRSGAESALAEIQLCLKQSEQSHRDILSCEAAVSELFVEKEKTQQDSIMLHEKVERLLEEQKQAEQLIRQKRAEQSEVDQKINQLKIELSQLDVKTQDLVERIQEQLQIDLPQAYENYKDLEVDWESLKDEIAQLKGKIERLGNVNVEAIEEQDELEKRDEFLTSQVEDLNKSKTQLQQLINRLNKKSREKFVETFEQIRVQFQELFRKLFGGGKADIMQSHDCYRAFVRGLQNKTFAVLSA